MSAAEEWRPVVGYESLYSVSNHGRVRAEEKMVLRPAGNNYKNTSKIMRPYTGSKMKYPIVRLRKHGEAKTFYVHYLVLVAFHGPRPEGLEVCHCDGNRENNAFSNLRWDTRKENHADKRLHGTSTAGERHPGAKLKDADILRLRERVSEGAYPSALGPEFGVSRMTAYRAATGKSWSHIK